jgi:hypothetical protein
MCQSKKRGAMCADVMYSFITLPQDSEIENDIDMYIRKECVIS